jgi:hypothetical protein
MARAKSVSDQQKEFLTGVPREALVAWVAALAKELPDVKRRLDLFAARNSDAASAAATYRATILTLTKSRNRNPQKRAREARINFENMTKSLTSDFEGGRLALVLDIVPEVLLALDVFLAEHADPHGKVRDLIPALSALHLDAATELRPGGEKLAAQLAKVGRDGMRSGLFRDAAYTYRDVLGDEGLALYRELIEPDWQLSMEPARRYQWQLRMQVQEQMLAWARAQESPRVRAAETAKIQRGVALTAEQFLEAAESFSRAGDEDGAAEALGTGFTKSLEGGGTAPGTLLTLAQRLMETNDPVQAEEIAWKTFAHRPSRDSYLLLLQAGAGTGRTQELREQAMGLAKLRSADLTLELLVAEDKWEEAAAVVKGGQLTLNGWLLWAREVEKTSPTEAVSAWFQVADRQVELPGEGGRVLAAGSLKRAREIGGGSAQIQFVAEWAAFRERHRRRGMMLNQLLAGLG